MNSVKLSHAQRGAEGTGTTPLLIVLLVVASLFMVLLAASVTESLTAQIFYGSLVISLLGLAAAFTMARGHGLRLSLASGQLGPYFGLSTALVFGLTSLIWSGDPPIDQAALIASESVLSAMVIVGIGLGCFVLGYMAVTPGLMRPIGSWLRLMVVSERPLRSGQGPAWLLMGLALLADAVRVAGGNFGYLSDVAQLISSPNPLAGPLSIISGFSIFAVALAAHDYARRRSRWGVVSLSILLIIQSAVGVFGGDKQTLALGFVAALLGYASKVRRLPVVSLSIAVLVFVFLVVPLNTNYRNIINVGNSRLTPQQAVEQFSQQGFGSILALIQNPGGESPQARTLARISRIGNVAIIVQKTPSTIPYQPVTELLEAPILGLVPRVVWPDKPVFVAGYQVSQLYYGRPSNVYTSDGVPPQADLWRHGGWPVLVVGMALLGLGVRVLDTATMNVSQFPLCLLLVLLFFPYIVKQETDIVSLAVAIPSLLLSVALASRLVVRRKGDPTERAVVG